MKISTHVLDTSIGIAADGVDVRLERFTNRKWQAVASATTDADGRIGEFRTDAPLRPGVFRLTFATAAYFKRKRRKCFVLEASFTFSARGKKFHLPLLLNTFGVTWYKGT